jgi:hypothetical protein
MAVSIQNNDGIFGILGLNTGFDFFSWCECYFQSLYLWYKLKEDPFEIMWVFSRWAKKLKHFQTVQSTMVYF